ncbi:MAG: family 20 glycosylhydrolase, partial [Leifsonia sp.]
RLGQDWADGPTSLRQSYEWDPARIVPGLTEAHILGVEAPLWTETIVTVADIEEMVFPRLAAVAEIAWSPAPADTDAVKRFIDAIVLLKVNHLHLHLTDDQGWRIHINSWPNLTAHGGSTGSDGSAGGFYTQDEFRDLVAYAAERHVTIVPELDMPGHTNAALASYPELNADGVAPALYTGAKVGFSTLLTGDETTARFVDDVVREVAAITPGPYLHIGGDECQSTDPADFLRFIADASATVARHGKIPAGWHEMGKSDQLPEGTVGQYWDFLTPRGTAADETLSFVRQGGSVILSPADVAYLD